NRASCTQTVTVRDAQAPTAPAGLVVTAKTGTSISLKWNASADNVGVSGYRIYRGAILAGTANGLTFTDTNLARNTSYTYTIKAFDQAGNHSPASNSVTTRTAKK